MTTRIPRQPADRRPLPWRRPHGPTHPDQLRARVRELLAEQQDRYVKEQA